MSLTIRQYRCRLGIRCHGSNNHDTFQHYVIIGEAWHQMFHEEIEQPVFDEEFGVEDWVCACV